MRKRVCTAVVLVMVALGGTVLAQPSNASDTWGRRGTYQRMYNPATVESVSGTVESIDKVTAGKGMRTGIHLTIKTGKELLPVHLGPSGYVEGRGGVYAKGDNIEVKGSRVAIAGKPAIIAAEVKKGDKVLVLRNSAGIPAWSRRGR